MIEREDNLVVTGVAVAETAHVLTSYYRLSREVIVDHLVELLRRDNIDTFCVEKSLVIEGLLMCRPSGRVSIPDALIWAAARSSDTPVYTLDRRFPTTGIEGLPPR
jgi:predicted nucleic acid-binding protein